jgi:hypothetical protein
VYVCVGLGFYAVLVFPRFLCVVILRVPVALSLGVKRPGREGDHLPPSSVEVKNEWSTTPLPQVSLHILVLK